MRLAAQMQPGIRVQLHNAYDEANLGPEAWARVASCGGTWTVFQEWHWQRTWWEAFGRGELLIASAGVKAGPVALAPVFVDGNMVFFVGSGGSDYLDFIGDVRTPGVLEALLGAIAEHVPDLLGFRFYLVPDESHSGRRLQEVAASLGFECFDEGELAAPILDLAQGRTAQVDATKKRLARCEESLRRAGAFSILHLRHTDEILPWLEPFFAQHEARWQRTTFPSLFREPSQRMFYERLVRSADSAGWLRFSVAQLAGNPIAFHFGFFHRGTYVYYKPCYDIAQARYSPGQVLLRHLVMAALDEGASAFDFGIGDEPYKRRFASRVRLVRTWGLYPRDRRCREF